MTLYLCRKKYFYVGQQIDMFMGPHNLQTNSYSKPAPFPQQKLRKNKQERKKKEKVKRKYVAK